MFSVFVFCHVHCRFKLPCADILVWIVAADGTSVTGAVGSSDKDGVTVTMESRVGRRVTSSVGSTVVEYTVPTPPGAGVAEVKGPPFVGLEFSVEVAPNSVVA